ncbi:hypothetical protein DH2020_042407 [Rehmannia glutinosa]|uniref:Regulatory protein RecX n=1 Tax=Rehmannia glutinosa TaxID=99300 RepID=A0ABR0UP91_REHGL
MSVAIFKNKVNGAASLPVRYLEKRHNGPELNLARIDFSKNSSGNFLHVDSKNHDACRASDINYGLNLAVEEEMEGDFMALNDEFIEVPEKNVEESSKRCNGIQSGHNRQDVEKLAIELLAARAFTALELKKKLQGKRLPLDIVDAVITDFQSSLFEGNRRFGLIPQALFKKGISKVDAEKAIKLVFKDEDDGDQDSGIAMSKLSIDQLYVQASKQWQRSRGAPQETRKSRLVRWLQYRGFNWSVINYVLKKLESQNPSS